MSHKKEHPTEYAAYYAAKARCESPTNPKYHRYGGRGIQFLFTSFEQLFNEIGPRPSKQHSLDRIDVDRHYEPGNIRWATHAEQQRNRSDTLFITHSGITLCLQDWAERLNTVRQALADRLNRGWCADCTVSIPVRGGRCPHKRYKYAYSEIH